MYTVSNETNTKLLKNPLLDHTQPRNKQCSFPWCFEAICSSLLADRCPVTMLIGLALHSLYLKLFKVITVITKNRKRPFSAGLHFQMPIMETWFWISAPSPIAQPHAVLSSTLALRLLLLQYSSSLQAETQPQPAETASILQCSSQTRALLSVLLLPWCAATNH